MDAAYHGARGLAHSRTCPRRPRLPPSARRSGGQYAVSRAASQSDWFDDYKCDSMSENHIYIEFSLSSMVQSLRSVDKAEQVELKLSRPQGMNCLTVNIFTMVQSAPDRTPPAQARLA